MISKHRVRHEIVELLAVMGFIAPFVLAIASYRLYLRPFENALFAYSTAVVNAFAISKIILILDLAHVGQKSESRPLFVPTLHKSALTTLLFLMFRGLETLVHSLLHGQSFLASLDAAFVREKGEFILIGLVTFLAGVPFFALRELRRVLGVEKFRSIFFGTGGTRHLNG